MAYTVGYTQILIEEHMNGNMLSIVKSIKGIYIHTHGELIL